MHKFSDWTFSLELKGLLYREPLPPLCIVYGMSRMVLRVPVCPW